MTQHEAYITNEGAAYDATCYRNSEQAWHLSDLILQEFDTFFLKIVTSLTLFLHDHIKPGVWMGIDVIPSRHLTQNG